MSITIRTPNRLDEPTRVAVLELAASIEAADAAPPLSDQARSLLATDASPRLRHLLATDGDAVVGYAQLDEPPGESPDQRPDEQHDGQAAPRAAEVLGTPATLDPLLDALETEVSGEHGTPLELWAHGTGSRLLAVLARRDYQPVRTLWQLRWPVHPLTEVALAPGVSVRAFVPGRDEPAWLAVNAAAFAHHPEQGGWTSADLQAREAESWFDPAGFLLAERGPQLLGFHWTKRHSASLGEVYVIGVDPAAQGLQLGKALLVAGLEYLRRSGVEQVLLYVDESNTTAMALYEKYGFVRHDHDRQYRFDPSS